MENFTKKDRAYNVFSASFDGGEGFGLVLSIDGKYLILGRRKGKSSISSSTALGEEEELKTSEDVIKKLVKFFFDAKGRLLTKEEISSSNKALEEDEKNFAKNYVEKAVKNVLKKLASV